MGEEGGMVAQGEFWLDITNISIYIHIHVHIHLHIHTYTFTYTFTYTYTHTYLHIYAYVHTSINESFSSFFLFLMVFVGKCGVKSQIFGRLSEACQGGWNFKTLLRGAKP